MLQVFTKTWNRRTRKPLKVPYGLLDQFIKECEEVKGLPKDKTSKRRIRGLVKRCVSAVVDNRIVLPPPRLRALERSGRRQADVVCVERRKRRSSSTGPVKKASIVRESLFEWFSIMRHSVKARFPAKLLEIKAKQLVQDYVVACLVNGVKPNLPSICSRWLKGWQIAYRVSLRKPNRKYKVPKKFWKIGCKFFGVIFSGFDNELWNFLGYHSLCIRS